MRVNQFLPRPREHRRLRGNIQELSFMSSSDRGRGDAPGSRLEPPVPAGTTPGPADAADPYANWLDRMQRARARHAAITKNLYTWSNYKNWADKMRDNWEDEDPNVKVPSPGTRK
jgi:hypothetical protein